MNFTDVEITFEYAAAWMGTGRFLEDYEIIATWFYRETGSLRPGKDCQNESYEDRLLKWQTWQPRAVQRMAIWLAEQQDKLNKSTQDLEELRAKVKELELFNLAMYCHANIFHDNKKESKK